MRPGEPLDKDIYDLSPEELRNVPKTPGDLDEAMSCLEKDHEFLLQSDVFTDDVISTWIWYKREKEVTPSACVRIHTSFTCTTTREKAFQAPRMRYSDSWG